jgi:ABC-type amino acid transport substrate-binding protein
VVAFQGATRYLGAEFAAMAKQNRAYIELPHMPSRMLSLNRTDVIVSQPDIFRFNLAHESSATQSHQVFESFEYHDILPAENQYWFGFRDEAVRDRFERGIAAIYANGEIDALFRQYQQRYGTSRGMFISLDCQFLTSNRPKTCAPSVPTKK